MPQYTTGELADRQKQLDSIRMIKECIRQTNRVPVNSVRDIEHMMDSKKKLKGHTRSYS